MSVSGGSRLFCRFGKLLASLVLVHGLVSLPLLVVCIRTDGQVFVELAGYDPCHHTGTSGMPGLAHETGPLSVFQSDDEPDPCLDLTLYTPASVQHADALLPELAAAVVGLSESPDRHQAVEPALLRRPLRESLKLPGTRADLCTFLRI
jgi:hypothetical protein